MGLEGVASAKHLIEIVGPGVVAHEAKNRKPDIGLHPITLVPRFLPFLFGLQEYGRNKYGRRCRQSYRQIAPLAQTLVPDQPAKLRHDQY